MADLAVRTYSSKIIKAGALLADTRTLLAYWDESISVPENLERFQQDNLFGKASRSRVEDILVIFRQRFLSNQSVSQSLVNLANGDISQETLDRILYFHAAQADTLLHDIVTEWLWEKHQQGGTDVPLEDIQRVVQDWVDEGKTTSQWSDYTILRVARGLLSTLRDFGILEGNRTKQLATVYLPVEAFAYIAFYLKQRQPSGELLLADPEWRLFFLAQDAVEHFFMEAHQHRLLDYHAAGSVIRITFPAQSLEEYANAIVQRSA